MKTGNQEVNKPSPYQANPRHRHNLNSFLAGAATVLALLALGVGGYIFYQTMESGQVSDPLSRFLKGNRPATAPSTVTPASPSGKSNISMPDNPYIQSALANKAFVELLSVKRITGTSNEINVDLRIYRRADQVTDSDKINLGATTARNSVNSETYKSIDPLKRSSGTVALSNLHQGQPKDAYVVLKVPAGVMLIDLFIENTGTFKNILVADAEPEFSFTPPSSIPTPTTNASPGKLPNPTSGIGETVPIPGTKTSVFPSPNAIPVPQGQVGIPASPSPAATENSQKPNVKPDKSVQKALGNKAQVQVLSAQRITNPQSGKQDVVNVQLRISRLADEVDRTNIINVPGTIARNPVSNTTYTPINALGSSTKSIPLYTIPRGESVDASIALKIPEGVYTIDLYVPETGTFKQVQISKTSPLD